MLLKLLACSTDDSTLETLNDWVAHHPKVELHTTSSPGLLGELLSSDAFNALLLDGRDPQISFAELMPRLALIPGMKVLMIEPQGEAQSAGSQYPNPVESLQTPLTGESLSVALQEMTDSIQLPEKTPALADPLYDNADGSDEDLSYLKGWIVEEQEATRSHETGHEEPPLPANLPELAFPPAQPEAVTSVLNEFSCVLLPRDPQIFLTHAIAERLALTLPMIHTNNGWRLTGISIRPQYLHWSLALPAATSPTSAIHEIMHLTSEQLFDTFPDLNNDAAKQGFWAQEYLVVSGTQSAPYTMIKAFMDRTRRIQPSGD